MPKTVPQIPGLEPGRLPFSPVVEANGLVFLAGQVGAPPGGDVVPGGTGAETRQVLDNVGQLLRAVGLDYGAVVRCTVFLVDMADFAVMNEVYREYFPTDMPVRATVGVSALAGPYRIEIDVTAAR
jgi:2-iminobutanoate/2-iminopropanoate deaminase